MFRTTIAFLCITNSLLAAVSLTPENGAYRLENESLRLSINPAKGGMVDHFFVKASGKDLIGDGCSLLADHFWQQNWPGEFMSAAYQATIVTNTPEMATLEVSCVSKGWDGSTAQSGIRVVRRLTLRAGSPLVEVSIRLENTGLVGRVAGYWSQQIFYADGDRREKHSYYRPSVRAVSDASFDNQTARATVDYGSPDGFVRDPQHGWMATLSAESHRGLAFVMRYDELMFLYNCLPAFTTEWQYKTAAIPAGKVWATDFVFYPVANLPRVDYASRRLVAAVEPTDKDGTLTVRVSLAAAGQVIEGITLEGDLLHVRQANRPTTPLPAQQCARVAGQPAVLTLQATHAPADPVAIRLTVRGTVAGQAFAESFETWYGAGYGKNWQVDGTPLYTLPTPERHVTFLKPDTIVKTHNAVPHVLFCRGMFADAYLPAATFSTINAAVQSSYFKPTATFPATLSSFPSSYEELMALDIIALINVDAAALEGVGEEMLRDFVQYGGTLIYGGDLWAYTRGIRPKGRLAELLPVTFTKGAGLKFLKAAPVLRGDGRPLAPQAVMAYASGAFTPKAGAQVLAQCGNEPVLVAWPVGQGRVIAITGTVLGDAPPGTYFFTAPRLGPRCSPKF